MLHGRYAPIAAVTAIVPDSLPLSGDCTGAMQPNDPSQVHVWETSASRYVFEICTLAEVDRLTIHSAVCTRDTMLRAHHEPAFLRLFPIVCGSCNICSPCEPYDDPSAK